MDRIAREISFTMSQGVGRFDFVVLRGVVENVCSTVEWKALTTDSQLEISGSWQIRGSETETLRGIVKCSSLCL